MKAEESNIQYLKRNSAEDYINTPISVRRYVNELETKLTEGSDMLWKAIHYLPSDQFKTDLYKYLQSIRRNNNDRRGTMLRL